MSVGPRPPDARKRRPHGWARWTVHALEVAAAPHPYVGTAGVARAWAVLSVLLFAVVTLLHLVGVDNDSWLASLGRCALLALLVTAHGHRRATRRR